MVRLETGAEMLLRCRSWLARAIALASLFLSGCAGPFNQVTPCIVNCAVTLNGSPATAPAPAGAVVAETVRVR